jgi:putative aldouronate transport system permease protein
MILREILIYGSETQATSTGDITDMFAISETIRYTGIVIATAPILCVYPFLQKYFTKGVMLGAIKG